MKNYSWFVFGSLATYWWNFVWGKESLQGVLFITFSLVIAIIMFEWEDKKSKVRNSKQKSKEAEK